MTELNENLAKHGSSYQRTQMQTYMTAPVWRNVDMADEFAAFLESHIPFYLFLYFSQMIDFWKILGNSVRSARQQNCSWRDIFFFRYFIMDVFIGCFTSIEYLVKGIISLPIKTLATLFGHNINTTDTQLKLAEVFRDYANFIHHTPFYDYAYSHWVGELGSTFWNSSNKSLDDLFNVVYYTFELPIRGLIWTSISWIYNSDANQAYETIDVLFTYKPEINRQYTLETITDKAE